MNTNNSSLSPSKLHSEKPEISEKFSHQAVKKRLLIMTTVSSTFENNLVSQPKYLSKNYEVRICSTGSTGLKAFAEKEGVKSYSVDMYRGINVFKDLKSIALLLKILNEFQPDIVHSYTPKAGLVNAVSGVFRRKQISIHTFTGLVFLGEKGLKRKVLITIGRIICRLVNEVIPEGEGVKRNLERYQVTDHAAPVIWNGNINGVDLKRFCPEVRQSKRLARFDMFPNIPHNATVFSFVGRINRHKGFEELMQAFISLQSRYSNTYLLVAGRIENKNPVDPSTLELLTGHKNIHYLGFTREIENIFSIADVNILPSYREGVPNVVLQSSAMGLPSIVSNISGCTDIVKDRFNGWLVPAKDSAALEMKMDEIVNMDKIQIESVGANARQLVQKKFDRKDVQRRLSDYYTQLLERSQRA